MTVRVIHDDCLAVIPKLVSEGVLVDACVTDAPYHLTATIKRFGAVNAAPAQEGRDGAMRRLSGGFMNQQWDGGDIAFRPETWATVASIMRPGAFLVAFGGTRTHHRVWCAIEDGGFVIQDTIMWLFGSGFPKRRDHLKPAFEPVCLAYKPGGKRTMQVDECRIGTERIWEYPNGPKGNTETSIIYGGGKGLPRREEPLSGPQGRWPANICHDGSDEVLAAFPQSAGQQYAVKGTETRKSNGIFGAMPDPLAYAPRGDSGSAARFFFSAKAGDLDRWTTTRHELTLSWTSGQGQCQVVLLVAMALSPPRVIAASGSMDAQEWNTFLFGSGLTDLCRKASKSTIKTTISSTIGLLTWSWLTRLLTSDCIPVAISSEANGSSHAEDVESTSLSISFTLDETAFLPNADHVLSGASFRISGQEKHVGHPTVKPISLMEWLVKLVCPENGLVLDPFAGTGTTGLAAMRAKRNAILIERELSYVADIRERIAFYEGEGRHSLAAKARRTPDKPLGGLFDAAG